MKYFYTLLLSCLTLFSCNKDDFNVSTIMRDVVWVPGATIPSFDLSNKAHVTIISTGGGWTGAATTIDVYGGVVGNDGTQIAFEQMSINGHELSAEGMYEEGLFSYHFNELEEDQLATFQSILGSFEMNETCEISVTGTSKGDYKAELEMPLKVEMSLLENRSYLENSFTIRPKDDIIVHWDSPTTTARTPSSIGIAVVYNPGLSRIEDPSLPTSLPIWFEITEDDGEYTIPAEELEFLPLGAQITVSVARGVFEEYTYELNGNELIVNGVTYEVSKFLTVIE